MPLPVTFATLAEGDQPASLLDDQFAALAGFVTIPCQAVGQNQIQLFPFADAPAVEGYSDLAPVFAFTAVETCSGAVELNVMNAEGAGLGSYPAYKHHGATPVAAGDLVAGCAYRAYFLTRLNAGSGGFVVDIPARGAVVSDLVPATPFAGMLWWCTTDGQLYVHTGPGGWVAASCCRPQPAPCLPGPPPRPCPPWQEEP